MRTREVLLWLVVLVGVFNFTPALFTPTNLVDEPAWQKALKDLPIILLLITAFSVSSAETQRSPELLRRFSAMTVPAFLLGVTMIIDFSMRDIDILAFLVSARYYVLYPMLALAVWKLDLSRPEIYRLAVGVVVLGAFEGGLSVATFLGVVGESYYQGYIQFGESLQSRATGTLGNPNNLGLFLGLPALLIINHAVFPSWRGKILLVPILIGMALTFSKTVAVAFALVVVFQATQGWRRGAALRVAGIVSLSVAFMYFTISGRVGGVITKDSILGSRVVTTPEAFQEWFTSASSFLVGGGYGSEATARWASGSAPIITDTMMLFLALEGGVVALLLFTAVVIGAVRVVAFAARAAPSDLMTGLVGYSMFFLLYSPVTTNFRLFPGAEFFWLCVGLMATLAGSKIAEARATGDTLAGRQTSGTADSRTLAGPLRRSVTWT